MSTWTVIVQQPNESFSLDAEINSPVLQLSLPESGSQNPIRTNFLELMPNTVSLPPLLLDLCLISMVIYSIDIKIPRDASADRWTRNIRVLMPVSDVTQWEAISEHLSKTLNFLSGDSWSFGFRAARHSYEFQGKEINICRSVSLLSGGLDSLVGAIDLLAAGHRVAMVSHHGAGITNTVQLKVLEGLHDRYNDLVQPMSFYVQAPKISGSVNEQTMRARSFLFMCLGLAVSDFIGSKILTVAENGFISLNVPLTEARMGSLSTRTTHPFFMESMRQLIKMLKLDLKIEAPYQFLTKGEMLSDALDQQTLHSLVPKTMSCTHPESGRFAGKSPSNHCGYCVPCIIRRAALNAWGEDPTKYNVSIKRNAPDSQTAKGRDLRAFKIAAKKYQSRKPHQLLFDVMSSGPLASENIREFIDIYKRGMGEVIEIL